MMNFIFLILLFAVVLAWVDRPKIAKRFLVLTLVLASLWFIHHITTQLLIQL